MSSKYDISQGTLLEGFESTDGLTITNGTGSVDSILVQHGSSSLKIISDSGATCSIVKTIDLDLSGASNVVFWFYLPSVVEVSSVQIQLSNDSDFSNYFTINVQFHGYWNKLIVPRGLWGSSGSPSWFTSFTRLRLRITAQSSQQATIYFDGLYYQQDSRPKCIISFDDGWDDVYVDGFSYLQKYGFKAVNFIVSSYIDDASRLTTAQVQEVFDAGWDICNHTETHTNLETGHDLQSEVETELATCRDYIIANGWNRNGSAYHVAYPQGGYDAKTLAAMEATGMITGRLTTNRLQANEIDAAYLITRRSHSYTSSAATYKGWIDQAIQGGGCVQLNYHKIVDDAAGAFDTEVERSQFRDIIDYLDANRTRIDVVTMTEWYRGISEARRIV